MGQVAASFLLCEITERQNVSVICLTSENETEQDGGRDTEGEEQEGGQKDTGGKGRREGGGGDLEEFWDLL